MQEQVTPLISIAITALLSAWKLDSVRKSTFDLFGKLPRFLQWLPAVLVGMLATGMQGYLDGLRGSELFTFAAGNGAEAGALAIAIWHVVKRFKKEAVAPVTALLFVGLLGFGTQSCSLEAARQARINSQLKAGAYGAPVTARPAAECKTLDDIHVYTAYGAEVSLGVGVGAGALAAANTSQDIENAAVATGIGAAAVAGTLAYWSQKSGAQWTERCGQ